MTKKQLSLMFAGMTLLSLIVSAVTLTGAIWYMKNSASLSLDQIAAQLPFQSEPEPVQPTFHQLDKLVLSVKGQRQTHFVMLELAVKTRFPEQIQGIDDYMPVVRNSLLKLFSQKRYETLQQAQTIDALQDEVKQTLLAAFADTRFADHIDDVLFTKYVIQ